MYAEEGGEGPIDAVDNVADEDACTLRTVSGARLNEGGPPTEGSGTVYPSQRDDKTDSKELNRVIDGEDQEDACCRSIWSEAST